MKGYTIPEAESASSDIRLAESYMTVAMETAGRKELGELHSPKT
jgi:hypothetical protein